ncbi:palmitoyltransferase ZDHHC5-A-like [Physella acuta]|uniref:palmitoyltransferase ZDHHC5-A-like n=1 Tax=Physella acuta TaxID=109671 RepID=UPI0027DB043B|nr:palmitoyltransferase ZDHHC5-A-like [Physella acuta]
MIVFFISGKAGIVSKQDASTQTDYEDVLFNMTTGEPIQFPYTYYNPSSYKNAYRRRESVDRGSKTLPAYFRSGLASDQCDPPVVIDFTRPHAPRDDQSIDSLGNPAPKRAEKRLPSLRLDLLAAPRSPTTELVAKDHGFALEGVEVPHYPGGGSRSLPSSGSDIFKSASESRRESKASIKPLTPSPAVISRIHSPHTAPVRQTSGHHHHHHHHHHRHRRPESLDFMLNVPPSQPPPSKKSSALPPRSSRAQSSSPRGAKELEKHGLKLPADLQEPRSAPIPKHMYHQDEEGFFSSSHSSSYNTSRVYQPDGDSSRKGILFFSRLSGAGRNNSNSGGFGDQSGGSAGGAMYGAFGKSGSYRSGGFES